MFGSCRFVCRIEHPSKCLLVYQTPTCHLFVEFPWNAYFIPTWQVLVFVGSLSVKDTKPLLVWLQVSDIGLLCLIPLASLGIHGTAERLPFGRCLLQLVFARGTKVCTACRWQSKLSLPSSESESSEWMDKPEKKLKTLCEMIWFVCWENVKMHLFRVDSEGASHFVLLKGLHSLAKLSSWLSQWCPV